VTPKELDAIVQWANDWGISFDATRDLDRRLARLAPVEDVVRLGNDLVVRSLPDMPKVPVDLACAGPARASC
jgi:hypothetical protein